MVSTSEMVRQYIQKRPSLYESLEKDIINYSALARVISDELKARGDEERSIISIKMALIRNRERLVKEKMEEKKDIEKIYNKTSVELKDKVVVVHSRAELKVTPLVFSKTRSGYTYILDENEVKKVSKLDTVKLKEEQCLITLKSTFEVEDVLGVLGHILSSLAGHHINITEIISCREDTHIVVGRRDAPGAFEVISDLLNF